MTFYVEFYATLLYGDELVKYTITCISKYFQIAEKIELEPPYVIYLSLLGLNNVFLKNSRHPYTTRFKFDRDEILLPGVIYEGIEEINTLMKPTFDILWQAAGWEGDPN